MRVEGSLRIIEDMLREVRLSRQEAEDLCEFVRSRIDHAPELAKVIETYRH
jgi:hypothetical protein